MNKILIAGATSMAYMLDKYNINILILICFSKYHKLIQFFKRVGTLNEERKNIDTAGKRYYVKIKSFVQEYK